MGIEPSDLYGIDGMSETVCLDHITDAVLRGRLEPLASELECSFCGRQGEEDEPHFAVAMDDLGAAVWEAANFLYTLATDVQYFDGEPWSEESLYETSDVIYDTVGDSIDDQHSEPIVNSLVKGASGPDHWVGGSLNALALDWASFSRTVRHESRFVLSASPDRPGVDDEPPARIARFLEALVTYVESDLLVELPVGSMLYRGRMAESASALHEKVEDEPSGELGPAPAYLSEAGRLAPAGISLFYAADSLDTAVAEIALHSSYSEAVVGGFRTKRVMQVLDFSRELTTKLPSVFAEDRESRRRWTFARFKDQFTDMISAPVLLDGRQLVDYAPTQVVAEWLRFAPSTRIDGIAWPSRVASGTGRNVMLFLGPGPDFQTEPATASELERRGGSRPPALTLSRSDISHYSVERAVTPSRLSIW
ncbi:RES domain-containing protein [Tessaracoccus sp. MC1756]|uniref:RES domain-containing protein n=1 Tax=Tessaracoccus sp. MC1756 TaxID=2760311 RepID=UPI0016011220|nr:RES domain-containing protein [Tessaracoccus sp. MC1756]MBB1510882.1 RES domain-containing protein [Tessaracoccus sp. MC1756]